MPHPARWPRHPAGRHPETARTGPHTGRRKGLRDRPRRPCCRRPCHGPGCGARDQGNGRAGSRSAVKVVVTRPEPDASRLAERLKSLGHVPLVCPAMTVRFAPGAQPAAEAYQAILITSANGMRALEQTRNAAQLRSTPVVAVGATSAKLAASLGYHHVLEADGNVKSLAMLVADRFDPGKGPLLYVTGTSRAGDLKTDLETHGFKVDQLELYTAKPLSSLPEQIRPPSSCR
jgi:uroporphyrinogen-III synthase